MQIFLRETKIDPAEHSSGFYEDDPGWQQPSPRTEGGVMSPPGFKRGAVNTGCEPSIRGLPKEEIPQNNSDDHFEFQRYQL